MLCALYPKDTLYVQRKRCCMRESGCRNGGTRVLQRRFCMGNKKPRYVRFFKREQFFFLIKTAGIAGKAAAGADDAVARNNHGNRIAANRAADCLRGYAGASPLCGKPFGNFAVGYRPGSLPEKYTSSQRHAASSAGSADCAETVSGAPGSSVRAKYFCPSNHTPVTPVSSAANSILPSGESYQMTRCILFLLLQSY